MLAMQIDNKTASLLLDADGLMLDGLYDFFQCLVVEIKLNAAFVEGFAHKNSRQVHAEFQ